MDSNDMVAVFGILLTMIPVAGFTFAFVVKRAIKPLVETLAEALRESRAETGAAQLSGQLLMLQEELESVSHELRELKSAHEFDRRLLEAKEGGGAP